MNISCYCLVIYCLQHEFVFVYYSFNKTETHLASIHFHWLWSTNQILGWVNGTSLVSE